MAYLFLKEDYDRINRQIEELASRVRDIGHEMGLSCQEGAETFHDNFAYEDGERQQRMWARRLLELLHIRNGAQVVQPSSGAGSVAIGRRVTVRDVDTGEERSFLVGSYMVFDGDEVVSYVAPRAQILIGAHPGEIREGMIAGVARCFEVLDVA